MAAEYRRVFRPPWEVPAILVGNGVLMSAAWFLLPPPAHAWLFTLNGPLAFPIILGSWMLADTPATNVLGADPALALSVMRSTSAYWRWLSARCIVLGSLAGLPSAIVALVLTLKGHPWSEALAACVILAVLPIGILPIAAWLGILFPYHARPLRWRWEHRREWHSQLRWVTLVFAPYFLVPAVGAAILVPAVALTRRVLHVPTRGLTAGQLDVAALMVMGTVAAAAALGFWGSWRLLVRRADRLAAYLASDEAG